MSEKLVSLSDRKKPRVHYRQLAKRFRRPALTRELEPVAEKEIGLHPELGADMVWYTSRYSGPGDSYMEARVAPLRELGLSPELLVYRVLRDLFDVPDIITVAFPKKALEQDRSVGEPVAGAFPWEWSFLLKGAADVYVEIRKQPGTQDPHLAVWVPKVQDTASEKMESVAADVKLFIEELSKTLRQSRHLLDQRQIKGSSTSLGPLNLYSDLLAAGDELVAQAARMGRRYDKKSDKDTASAVGSTLGTFYLAAATNYLLALEAFVNLLIELLRKPEFEDEVFDRATTKADFELRVLSLSLYCVGFRAAPFPSKSSAFRNIRKLRTFRNNLLHGNVSRNDHVLYVVPEDFFYFHWWPAADDVDQQTPFEELPLSRVLFRKGHALNVRRLVEDVVNAIQDSLEPEYLAWVKNWRNAMLVPAVLKEGKWEPNLKPSAAYLPKKKKK